MWNFIDNILSSPKTVIIFIIGVILCAGIFGYYGFTKDTAFTDACKNAGGIVIGEKYRMVCINQSVVLPIQTPW